MLGFVEASGDVLSINKPPPSHFKVSRDQRAVSQPVRDTAGWLSEQTARRAAETRAAASAVVRCRTAAGAQS